MTSRLNRAGRIEASGLAWHGACKVARHVPPASNRATRGRRVASVAAMLGGAIVGAMLVLSVGLAWPLALIGAGTLLATLAYVAYPAAAEGA